MCILIKYEEKKIQYKDLFSIDINQRDFEWNFLPLSLYYNSRHFIFPPGKT